MTSAKAHKTCGTTWLRSQASSTWTTDDTRRAAGLSQQQQQQPAPTFDQWGAANALIRL